MTSIARNSFLILFLTLFLGACSGTEEPATKQEANAAFDKSLVLNTLAVRFGDEAEHSYEVDLLGFGYTPKSATKPESMVLQIHGKNKAGEPSFDFTFDIPRSGWVGQRPNALKLHRKELKVNPESKASSYILDPNTGEKLTADTEPSFKITSFPTYSKGRIFQGELRWTIEGRDELVGRLSAQIE